MHKNIFKTLGSFVVLSGLFMGCGAQGPKGEKGSDGAAGVSGASVTYSITSAACEQSAKILSVVNTSFSEAVTGSCTVSFNYLFIGADPQVSCHVSIPLAVNNATTLAITDTSGFCDPALGPDSLVQMFLTCDVTNSAGQNAVPIVYFANDDCYPS